AGRPAPARRAARHGKLTPWVFMAIALLSEGIFTVFPFLNTIVLAFTDATRLRGGKFVGFDNFTRMWDDERFWRALENSTLYMVVVVPCMVFLPLLLAMLVNTKLPGAGFFRTAFYVPVVSSTVAVGIMWTWLLDPQGLVNQTFKALGFISEPIPFLTDRWLLMGSAMFVTIWTGLGWYMVIYLAALTNVSKDLYDAAAMDGAGWWRRFFSVTIPGVRNTMVLIAALSSVAAFRVFTEIYVLSGNSAGPGGSALTLVMLIQRVGTGLDAEVGYASALSIVVFVITIGLMIAVLRMQNRENEK
ncbi:MAG TPA: sugar ABC transporter permease, partial [Streptomyces sp.]